MAKRRSSVARRSIVRTSRNKFFPHAPERIPYEGPDSKNPFAYKWFDPNRVIEFAPNGRKIKTTLGAVLRFSIAYWHAMRNTGADIFGPGAANLPWPADVTTMADAKQVFDALCELCNILGVGHYCWHDTDLVPQGESFKEFRRNLSAFGKYAESAGAKAGVRTLWGTQNVFSHPRYMLGAGVATSADVWAYAAAQTGISLELSMQLGALGHVYWGGREGTQNLLNRDLSTDLEHRATALAGAVAYADEIGFTGVHMIEPKPKEPMAWQHDSDVGATFGFLRRYNLHTHFGFNVEDGHAFLAGKPFENELALANSLGKLWSIDANHNHPNLHWDTDHMSYDTRKVALACVQILLAGGLKVGINVDAKVRRESTEPEDRVLGHILTFDTYAKGMLIAVEILNSGDLESARSAVYSGWNTALGRKIEAKKFGVRQSIAWASKQRKGYHSTPPSGQEEMFEMILNSASDRVSRAG